VITAVSIKRVPVTVSVYVSAYWDTGGIRVTSAADAPRGFHAFQAFVSQKCILFQKLLVSIQSPDKNFLLIAVIPLCHWSALNTPKYLGVSTATIQTIKYRVARRPVSCTSTSCLLSTESPDHVLSASAQKIM